MFDWQETGSFYEHKSRGQVDIFVHKRKHVQLWTPHNKNVRSQFQCLGHLPYPNSVTSSDRDATRRDQRMYRSTAQFINKQ